MAIRGGRGPVSDGNFVQTFKALVRDAEEYVSDRLHADRIRSWESYHGNVEQGSEPGRSKFVMREVQDSIDAALPEILDIFETHDHIVEFRPRRPEDVDMARQATQTVNYIYKDYNDGFRLTYDVIKNGLVAKCGIFKIYYDEAESAEEIAYSGLTMDELRALLGDPEVELLELEAEEGEPLPQEGINATIKRTEKSGKYIVEVVQSEDFIIHESAVTEDEAILIGQRTELRVSDVVEMGIPLDDVLARAGERKDEPQQEERAKRRHASSATDDEDPTWDETLRPVVVYECYAKIDYDDDGIAERYRILALGDQEPTVVHAEPWADQPYCVASPFLTPGTVIGDSLADRVIDIQEVSTFLMRATLDNAARVGNPRTVAVEGQVNFDDLLDNKHAGVVRSQAPGMVQDLTVPYVGDKLLPITEYIESRKQQRTGLTKAGQGLDPDALQSSTLEGVRATVTAARRKVKLYAKVFAECAFKKMAMKMLRLLIERQDKPFLIRLNNEFVPVDPASWRADMDVYAEVGLGTGDREEQTAALMAIAAKQEQILMQMGPQNPLVSLSQYARTLRKASELAGFKDADMFFNPPQMVEQLAAQQAQQAAEQEGQPDPETQAKIQKMQMETQARQQKTQADIQLARAKAQADLATRSQEAQQKLTLEEREAQADASLERWKAQQEARLAEWEARQKMALREAELRAEAQLEAAALRMQAKSDTAVSNRNLNRGDDS